MHKELELWNAIEIIYEILYDRNFSKKCSLCVNFIKMLINEHRVTLAHD